MRQACGDPSFTLPYWDYMNPGLRALPAPFRVNGSALFRPNRDPAVNAGQAIDQGQPPNTINLQCLNQGAYAGFNSAISRPNNNRQCNNARSKPISNASNNSAMPVAVPPISRARSTRTRMASSIR